MEAKLDINQSAVVMKAYMNACKALGFNDEEKAKLIGVARSTLLAKKQGFAQDSKTYELQLALIRLYRSLFALIGGDQDLMREWFNDENSALHGTPREMCFSIVGLIAVNEYLDAMRGKI